MTKKIESFEVFLFSFFFGVNGIRAMSEIELDMGICCFYFFALRSINFLFWVLGYRI